ncbi:hypothetical protein [uncultured Sphingobacterium sp.]|uniref:hypothetical protein n=1 Tax=uncultured Sphingobacterium sp. TaxID=182688 RepID=UPI0025F57A96|nr:hypothetical protein [uncultured Sphingobacterium sp.]
MKNGSFEADKRHISSPVKPVQEQLLGWQTTIMMGNMLSVGDSLSPVLNYFNTTEGRKQIIGEKSLQINDKIDFKRKVSQIIQSSQRVKLVDGKYTLSAKFKRGSGFEDLYMYALSDGKAYKKKLSKADQHWSDITLANISIKNGRVEIGFMASGKANAYCYIDDVTLIRSK